LTRKYESSDSGLSYFFQNPNIIMKPDITIDPLKASHLKGGVVKFEEYKTVTDNERIVSIEYCSNCEDHQMHTMHSSEAFFNIAKIFSEAIKIRYPAISVLLKPIDTHIIKDFKQSYKLLEKSKNINDKYKPVRIGAFEINICMNKTDVVVLHSKLSTNQWPNLDHVLDKISKYTPMMNINLQLYESDNSGLSENESSLNTVHVNIYRVRFEEVYRLKRIYSEELELIARPKGIKKFMETMRYMEDSGNTSARVRPFTPAFFKSYDTVNPNNQLSKLVLDNKSTKRQFSSKDKSLKELSTLSLYDSKAISKYKGLTISKDLYGDSNGKITNIKLPYDSYFIETIENKNYKCSGNFIRYSYFMSSNEKIVKHLPLKTQTNSFIIVLVNKKVDENENENDTEYSLIDKATVFLQKVKLDLDEAEDFENKHIETRVKVKECENKPGRYEIVRSPGKYIIEVLRERFENFKKAVEVGPGENILDITLYTSKTSDITVSVYNFEKFVPISTCFLKLSYLDSTHCLEGVTDKIGKFVFSKVKVEEGISILAEKDGFFSTVRIVMGDLNNKDHISKEIIFILVSKNYVLQNNNIVMVSYSNLPGDNFTCLFNYSKMLGNYIDIDQFDTQTEHGVVSNLIKLRKSSL
jgi:hypothetical protein